MFIFGKNHDHELTLLFSLWSGTTSTPGAGTSGGTRCITTVRTRMVKHIPKHWILMKHLLSPINSKVSPSIDWVKFINTFLQLCWTWTKELSRLLLRTSILEWLIVVSRERKSTPSSPLSGDTARSLWNMLEDSIVSYQSWQSWIVMMNCSSWTTATDGLLQTSHQTTGWQDQHWEREAGGVERAKGHHRLLTVQGQTVNPSHQPTYSDILEIWNIRVIETDEIITKPHVITNCRIFLIEYSLNSSHHTWCTRCFLSCWYHHPPSDHFYWHLQ